MAYDFNPLSYVLPGTDPNASGSANYASLALREKLAAAMMGSSRRKDFPDTFGKGLTYLGESIGDRLSEERLMAMLAKQQQYQQGVEKGAPPSKYTTPDDALPPRQAENDDTGGTNQYIRRVLAGWGIGGSDNDRTPWAAL